jgi:hypothetical protein
VHCIAVYKGVVILLVIDDHDVPSWKPAWLFDTTNGRMPKDWICNTVVDWPELIVGPDFIAGSQGLYALMVELDKSQVKRLRERIKLSQQRVDCE